VLKDLEVKELGFVLEDLEVKESGSVLCVVVT
jgi:hypothetical protein